MKREIQRWVVPGALLLVAAATLSCTRGRGGGGVIIVSEPSITYPAGSELLAGTVDLTWNGLGSLANEVAIELSPDSGDNFTTVIIESTPDDGLYRWDTTAIPDGDLYRLRMIFTDTVDHVRAPLDSTANFTIDNTAPVVALTAPVGALVLAESVDITWSTVELHPGTVEVRLSSDGGTTFATVLATGLDDTETFTWDTSTVADDLDYRLRIVGTDAVGNPSTPAESIDDLAVDNTAPTIALTSPVGGEVIGDSHEITWTTTDAHPGTVEIRLSDDSGGTYDTVIAAAAPDTGSYVWDSSAILEAGAYRIRVEPTDEVGWPGASDDSPADFSVAHVPMVAGPALFRDENGNGLADAGDTLVVPFDRAVAVNGATESDFDLPVSGDTFGAGPTIAVGAVPTEVVVTFAAAPTLKARQHFDASSTLANSASGIDISASMTADAIEGAVSGVDAVPSEIVDVAPGFVDGGQVGAVAHDTRAAVLGDVDRDGNPDLLLGHADSTAQVFTGDGAGGFSDSGQSLGGGNTAALLLFDADGDGDEDLYLGNISTGGGNADSLYFNEDGTFSDSLQVLGNDDTVALAVGDLDGDGVLDVVSATDGGPGRLWHNDGAGTLSDSGQALGSGDALSVAVGDVDRDGDLDAVFGNATDPGTVFLNDGEGILTDSGQAIEAGLSVLGDVDGDGDLDLVKVCPGDELGIWENAGTGVFADGGFRFGDSAVSSLALADVDGSGSLDVIAGVPAGRDEIWLNDGTGELTVRVRVETTEATEQIAIGDLEGDGDLDLVSAPTGALARAHLNSLSASWGTFTLAFIGQSLAGGYTRSFAVGDVDGDGDLDLAPGYSSTVGGNRIFLNDGDGIFADSGQSLVTDDSPGVAMGDIDGDGDLDLVYGVESELPNRVFLNDGAGTFADSGQSLGSEDTWLVMLGDVDGDDDLDLFCGNFGGEADTIWLNDGAGIFSDSGQNISNKTTRSARFGDIDGDGDLDIVVGVVSGSDMVYENDGLGAFSVGQTLSSSTTYAIDLGDLDGDGDLDVLASTPSGGNEVWLNDAGVFSDSGQSLGSNATNAVNLVDLDGDGDLDTIETNWAEVNRVWLNDGAGIFSGAGVSVDAVSSRSCVVADLDGDGDPDAVFGMIDGDLVFLNE